MNGSVFARHITPFPGSVTQVEMWSGQILMDNGGVQILRRLSQAKYSSSQHPHVFRWDLAFLCKEGYHGLRCDQFVPKTDAILSDPTDELGIEFMESGDTYQRQVLSIFSIASGICLLGVACMALYRRNKRHREKLQAHFSDSRSLRDCSVHASGLMSKSAPRLQYSLQLQKSCSSHGSSVKGGSVAPGTSMVSPPILSRALSKGKRFRSSSLSLSPAQLRRETNFFKTPPISRGKHKISTNLTDGSRVGHVYKHLQEDESADMESLRRCDSASGRVGALLSRTSLSHFAAKKGWTEVPCTRLDKGTTFLPPSLRTRSVPIIPSLQATDLEAGRAGASVRNQGGLLKWHPVLAGKAAVPISNSPSPRWETVMPPPGAMPSSVSPPATATAPLGSGNHPSSANTPRPAEITVEIVQELKQRSLPSSVKMSGPHGEIHHGGTNTLETGTVQESERKGVQYSARVMHAGSGTRGSKAAGQREAQGQCQGQTSLVYGGANCPLAARGPSCRGTGNAHSKPSAS
ncbi:putative pro-neuregulin-3 membrane-bound [Scophthalmus maximus]|uniref:Putative pro-neuregulin-3 membrane-bound n=1 Tax=Scophthalmus maximus TaxID=52904 RepID=A0A2U9CMF9_SCOMX|nr:putative pro-neuregulin-3 membrane-bound [Scophthalmus maximus]